MPIASQSVSHESHHVGPSHEPHHVSPSYEPDHVGPLHEPMAQMRTLTDMPCVLDFYVHEDFQRQGALIWHST